jgi:hypothetical protein
VCSVVSIMRWGVATCRTAKSALFASWFHAETCARLIGTDNTEQQAYAISHGAAGVAHAVAVSFVG